MEAIFALIIAFLVRLGFYFLQFLNWLFSLFDGTAQNPISGSFALYLVAIVIGIVIVGIAHRKLQSRQPVCTPNPEFEKTLRIIAALLLLYFAYEAYMLLRTFKLLNDPQHQELMHPLSAYQIATVILCLHILGTVCLLLRRALALPILLLVVALQLGHLLITLIQYPYMAAHFARSFIFMLIKFGVPTGLAFYGWKQGVLTYGSSQQATAKTTQRNTSP